eukprot:CAMPEP_0196750992 /NCGR_PEP_ID=MMETSP1091-20130531/82272_1 /TAXON_ID=302021 /ORGANISM="Rhodomonas sp., Strain CCMP768" /LENGTH=44 /DNA_ID= /DNA_START= /DNA_END= /DNA_ORIENTATION=
MPTVTPQSRQHLIRDHHAVPVTGTVKVLQAGLQVDGGDDQHGAV